MPAELSAAIGPALEQARGVGPDQVLRLVDFLMRAGVDDEQLSAALSRDVVASLCDPHSGPRLIHRLGQRIGTEARLALAAESLKVTGHRDGLTELSDEVLDWLAEDITAPAPSELAQAQPVERHLELVRRCAGRAPNTRGQPTLRTAALWLWWLRICGSPRFEQVAAAEVWEPADAAGGCRWRPTGPVRAAHPAGRTGLGGAG